MPKHITQESQNIINVDAYADISTAITTIGSSNVELIIAEAETINTNLTVPENVILTIQPGGTIAVASGITLTIEGDFRAGGHEIFTNCGTIDFTDSPIDKVIPQWWGAIGDNINDDYDAIDQAIRCGRESRKVIFFPPGTYKTTNTIYIDNADSTQLIGAGRAYTTIQHDPTVSGTPCIQFDKVPADSYWNHNQIHRMNVVGHATKTSEALIIRRQCRFIARDIGATAQDSILVDYCMICKIEDARVGCFGSVGNNNACLKVTGSNTTFQFDRCWFEGAAHGIYFYKGGEFDGSGGAQFTQCVIQSNCGYGLLVNRGAVSMQDCHFEGNYLAAIKQNREFEAGVGADPIWLQHCTIFGNDTYTTNLIEIGCCALNLKECSYSTWDNYAVYLSDDTSHPFDLISADLNSWGEILSLHPDNIYDKWNIRKGLLNDHVFMQRSFANRTHIYAYPYLEVDPVYGGSALIKCSHDLTIVSGINTGQRLDLMFYNAGRGPHNINLPYDFYTENLDNKIELGPHEVRSHQFIKQPYLQLFDITINDGSLNDNSMIDYVTISGLTSGAEGQLLKGIEDDGTTYIYVARDVWYDEDFQEGETIGGGDIVSATLNHIKNVFVETSTTAVAERVAYYRYLSSNMTIEESHPSIIGVTPVYGTRNLTLPEPVKKNLWYSIFNLSSSEDLVIKRDDAATTITTIGPRGHQEVFWDGNNEWTVGTQGNTEMILTDTAGAQWKITVDEQGNLNTEAV